MAEPGRALRGGARAPCREPILTIPREFEAPTAAPSESGTRTLPELMAKHNWRWWFHAIHRDLGYLCAGLTVIYAISGVAVNHVSDWNPNYSIERSEQSIGPIPHGPSVDDRLAREVLRRLDLPPAYKTIFQPGPGLLRIIRENHTIDVDLATGKASHEFVAKRPIVHEANVLHLNHKKRLWTFVADAFAACLAVLAITGLFLIKGKKGIAGRGLWLTSAGVALPLLFLWLYS
ncbi:MAG: PepSY-associated TM helix domain-containing protein [Planctomycetota bacterium]